MHCRKGGGCRPILERCGCVCAWVNIPSQLGGGGVRGPLHSETIFADCVFISFFWRNSLFAIKRMCEEYYMKRIFSFTEGMVLDSYSFLEVGEAATASWIFFRKRNQMILFETIFSRLHVFCLVFVCVCVCVCVWFFFCHQALKWRVCDWGVFLDL